MHWDGTITAGNVIATLTLLGGIWTAANRMYYALDKRAVVFEQTITRHAQLLEDHTQRMAKQDAMLYEITGQMNRLLGRFDGVSPNSALSDAAAAAVALIKRAENMAADVLASASQKVEERRHS